MKKKTWNIIIRHVVLALLAFIWLIPIVWLVVTSLSATKGVSYQHFFPTNWTLANFHQLFFETDTAANFPAWFKNTFIVALFTCIISSCFVLMVSYAFSCMRFKARKPLMSFSIILGMFPGVLSMIAVYFVLKMIGLTDSLAGLVIVYSAGSGLGFLVLKGFFDTIPYSLDESAMIDGASRWQNFRYITLPFLVPTMTVNMVLNLKAGITTFDYAFALTGGGPNRATEFIGLMIYNDGFKDSNFAVANAKAVVLALIIAILSFIQIRQSQKHEIN